MSIKPINHYSLTNPASVYDEESMTALELAGRTAGKVNECVEALNEGLEGIPSEVDSKVQEHIDKGEFANDINRYIGNLKERLDNLFASYTSGSTSNDAELHDIRLHGDGQTYASAGDAVRADYDHVKAIVGIVIGGANHGLFKMVGTPTNLTYVDNTFISSTGERATPNNDNVKFKTARIAAKELTFYKVHALANFGNALYACYDAAGNVIDIAVTPDTGDITTFNGYIFAPKNTAEIMVAYIDTPPAGTCYPIDYIGTSGDIDAFTAFNSDLMSIINNLVQNGQITPYCALATDRIPISVKTDYIINKTGGIQPVNNSTLSGFNVGLAPVTPGKIYEIQSTSNYGNCGYAFYDVNENLLSFGAANAATVARTVKTIVTAPANADHVYIGYINTPVGYICPVKDFTIKTGYNWRGKKWAAIGDSLTETNNTSAKKYHDYIAEETGITVKNKGISGTGFVAGARDMMNFIHRLREAGEENDADIVSVFGSFNDLDEGVTDYSSYFSSAISDFYNYAVMPYQGNGRVPTLLLITPTPWTSANPSSGSSSAAENYVKSMLAVAAEYGVPCLDLFHSSGLARLTQNTSYFDANGVHPNDEGHKIIARQIREFIASHI